MTLRDLEQHLDRLEHALADVSPEIREPFHAFIGAVIRGLLDLNNRLDYFRNEAERKHEISSSYWQGSVN